MTKSDLGGTYDEKIASLLRSRKSRSPMQGAETARPALTNRDGAIRAGRGGRAFYAEGVLLASCY